MYKTIVVGTDFSDTAAKAVDHAVGLAQAFGSKLHVVTAFRPAFPSVGSAAIEGVAIEAEVLQDAEQKIRAELETRLAKAKDELAAKGIDVQTHSAAGDPADVLIETAEQSRADLIVVGNRRMSGMGRFVLGSVSNSVSHHAKCSVLIVHTTDNK